MKRSKNFSDLAARKTNDLFNPFEITGCSTPFRLSEVHASNPTISLDHHNTYTEDTSLASTSLYEYLREEKLAQSEPLSIEQLLATSFVNVDEVEALVADLKKIKVRPCSEVKSDGYGSMQSDQESVESDHELDSFWEKNDPKEEEQTISKHEM